MSAVDYGYGDATPDTADYGYGDAAPSTATDYGYGDATPSAAADYGYGDATPDTTDYGYGDDATPNNDDANKYGYGDDTQEISVGLNDDNSQPSNRARSESSDSGDAPRGARKGRYRRRGSVTKYSLDTADEVKKEYDEHEDVINKFRNQTLNDRAALPSSGSTDSGDLDSNDGDADGKKKKKNFMRGFSKRGVDS